MISEKQLVPKKRFEGFKNEWTEKSLNEISESFTYGLNVEAIEYDGKNKYLRITDIDDITKKFNKNELTSPHIDYEISSDYILSERDILFARTGASVGKTYRYSKLDGIVYYAGFLIKARIKKEYDIEFIFQNTLTKEYKKFVYVTSQRSGQPGINAQEYSTFKLFTPTIEEQQKIGEFFKVLDERIANQERKIAKVKSLKDAYLTEMFPQEGETVPKRRFQGFEGEWNETTLDNVLAYEQPTDYIVDEDTYDDSYDIAVLTAGQSFLLGYTNEKHGIKKADVDNSVIIFDDFTTNSHHVDFFFKVKSSALKILSSNSRKFTTYFAYLILNNIDYTPESHERHWISMFSNFEVMIPSMEEQQKIGAFFKNLDNQIEMEEKKLDKLQKMKDAYLEDMFV